MNWFDVYSLQNKQVDLSEFCMAFRNSDAEKAEKLFTDYLYAVISIRDNNVETAKKKISITAFFSDCSTI